MPEPKRCRECGHQVDEHGVLGCGAGWLDDLELGGQVADVPMPCECSRVGS